MDYVDNERNFIWNEGKHTRWGHYYFEALAADPVPGGGKHIGICSTEMMADSSASDTPAKDKAEPTSQKQNQDRR